VFKLKHFPQWIVGPPRDAVDPGPSGGGPARDRALGSCDYQLILPGRRRFGEWLHNQTSLGLQRRLHLDGIPLVVLPITLR